MSFWNQLFGRKADAPGTPIDPSAAPPRAGRAVPASSARDTLIDALRCALGDGRPRNDDAAFALMRAAAESGSVEAQRLAGVMQLFGVGTAEDEASGMSWLRKAADAGDPDAGYELGVWLEAGYGGGADSAVITGLYRAGAESGHLKCINGLLSRYRPGRGSEADLPVYLHWTRRAAELGDADAQYELGVRHANGDGVDRDLARALSWYERAASQDHALACHNLAVHTATGQGIEQDMQRAGEWYRRASDLGVAKSCRTLAAMHFHGQGVVADREKAARLMDRADELERRERTPATALDAAGALAAIRRRREQTVRDMLEETWRKVQPARSQNDARKTTLQDLLSKQWFLLPEGKDLDACDDSIRTLRDTMFVDSDRHRCAACDSAQCGPTASVILQVLPPDPAAPDKSQVATVFVCAECRSRHSAERLVAMARDEGMRNKIRLRVPDATGDAVQAGTAVDLLIGFLGDRVGYTLRSGSVSFGQSVMRPSDARLAGRGVRFVFKDTTLTARNSGEAAALLHLCLNLQDRLVALPSTGKEPLDTAGQLVMDPIRGLVRFGPSAELSVSVIDGIRYDSSPD